MKESFNFKERSSAHRAHWRKEDEIALREAKTYVELAQIALAILPRMPRPIIQVCGPISTGGKGSIEENLAVFEEAIITLTQNGLVVFDQIPFEKPMQRIKPPSGYDTTLLEHFYLPIFESGFIHRLCFLPEWKTSTGAQWEHEQAQRLGIEITYLSHRFDFIE